jgi:Phosphatidylinositol-4-phosphate 5-Kinase
MWQVNVQPQRGDKARPLDLLVMENVFYDQSLNPVYDLKGSTRARYVPEDPTRADIVLLDENLLESSISSPILVRSPPPPPSAPSPPNLTRLFGFPCFLLRCVYSSQSKSGAPSRGLVTLRKSCASSRSLVELGKKRKKKRKKRKKKEKNENVQKANRQKKRAKKAGCGCR